jgi:hypothetical protein
MTTKIVTVRRNADQTYTIRIGSYVEHISSETKTKSELFDAIKYAIISKGVNLSDASIIELMRG